MRRSLARLVSWRAHPFSFGTAIVKGLSPAFAEAALRHDSSSTIIQGTAEKQHAAYVAALRANIPQVIELPADADSPDCCFIEDTAVVVGETAVVTRPGADSRQGETESTATALASLGLRVVRMSLPARLDGGDVLFTGREFFVGLSMRTNRAGAAALAAAFPGLPVTPVPMLDILSSRRRGRAPKPGGSGALLHLKSACSMLVDGVVAYEDTPAGAALSAWMAQASRLRGSAHELTWMPLPDAPAANTVALGGALIVRAAAEYPESVQALQAILPSAVRIVEVRRYGGAKTTCKMATPPPPPPTPPHPARWI